MSKKDHLHLTGKYFESMQWLQGIAIGNPLEYNRIIATAKEKIMTSFNISSIRFDELKFSFSALIYDEEDQPIVDYFYEYVDSIRKTRQ